MIRCYFLLVAIALFLLHGCVFQSTQLDSIKSLATSTSPHLSETKWLVKYADYESEIYAISTNSGIIFCNRVGDQVFFDGWTINVVKGFGYWSLNLEISDLNKLRTIRRGNRIVAKHECKNWGREKQNQMIRFSQVCSHNNEYENQILVNSEGYISLIRQIVDESDTVLTLIKLE